MNIQHSSRSDSWATPRWAVDKVKEVLGDIDLDPASSYKADQTVQAKRYLDENYDSLNNPWTAIPVSVYLNPPGGKVGNKSKTGLFWNRLMEYRNAGLVTHAIFMAFSIEALQSTQLSSELAVGDFPICIPKRRIKFVDLEDSSKQQPSHSNVIVYVPGIVNRVTRFKEVFQEVGSIMLPY